MQRGILAVLGWPRWIYKRVKHAVLLGVYGLLRRAEADRGHAAYRAYLRAVDRTAASLAGARVKILFIARHFTYFRNYESVDRRARCSAVIRYTWRQSVTSILAAGRWWSVSPPTIRHGLVRMDSRSRGHLGHIRDQASDDARLPALSRAGLLVDAEAARARAGTRPAAWALAARGDGRRIRTPGAGC